MTPETILQAVSQESGIDMRSLLAKARFPHLVRPRQLAMVLLRERGGLSCFRTGLEMDRCEATVWEGYRSARRRLRADAEYRDLYARTLARLEVKG